MPRLGRTDFRAKIIIRIFHIFLNICSSISVRLIRLISDFFDAYGEVCAYATSARIYRGPIMFVVLLTYIYSSFLSASPLLFIPVDLTCLKCIILQYFNYVRCFTSLNILFELSTLVVFSLTLFLFVLIELIFPLSISLVIS